MDMNFENEEVPSDFMKTLVIPPRKKGDKTDKGGCRGISLIFVGSKLLSMMMVFRLGDRVDRVLREEWWDFNKGRGCVNEIFILRLIIDKRLSRPNIMVIILIGYEQPFDSADRRALGKFQSSYRIPDKYIKMNSAIYEDNIVAVKVGNMVSSCFHTKSGVQQGYDLSPIIWIILMYFVLRSTAKAMREYGIKRGSKTPRIKLY
ncbi:uncharacterized protein LOC136030643 [Artemia franciscana]|uniref:uncharacterized protein LOC136030643 n=1 Tax=Artemia franciscana TaxID=6661 RepID=UPI0032DA106F